MFGGKKYSIREYAVCLFPIDRELLEKVDPNCLFIIVIMMNLSVPEDAVPPKPGKQRAVTFTSCQAASSHRERQ